MHSQRSLSHGRQPYKGQSQPPMSDFHSQRPISPSPTMRTTTSSSFERSRGYTTHHRRQESSLAYTSNTCGSLSSSKSMDSIKRSGLVFDGPASPVMVTTSLSTSPVLTSSPLFSAASGSPPTSTSSRSIYWPAQNDQSPTRSLQSTDAIKSPCASPHSTAHSQSVVSNLLRRSSSKELRNTVHSHRSSVTSASSNHTSHGTAGKRISDPIFQAASNGMEPNVFNEQGRWSSSASRSEALDDTSTSAGTTARRRLLSTAYEEPEVSPDVPSTPRHNRIESTELKSKFSHSPTPHKNARKEAETNAFNRSLAALRKSLGDTGRPDLSTLEEMHIRSASPLPAPPSKGRKMLGFLGSSSRCTSPLPFDPGRRSSCGTQSSGEEKRGLKLSLKQRSKSKLRLGSKLPVDGSRPSSPMPPRAPPSPPPPLPVRGEPIAGRPQTTSHSGMEPTSLPVPGHRQHTNSHLTVSSQYSQSSKGTSSEGKCKGADRKSHSPRKPRSLRSFRLIPRSSPKKRPSRPPLTVLPSQPVIRDSWIDLKEDVQFDGSSAINGLPTSDAFEQRRGGIIAGKRKRTWNLASKPAPPRPWEFNPKLAPYCPTENTTADHLRMRKQSIVAETAPRLPSLALGRMTPIGERSVDRLVQESDAEQENRAPNAVQDSTRPKSPPKRLFMLPNAVASGPAWEGRPRPAVTGHQNQPHSSTMRLNASTSGVRPRLHPKPNRFDATSIPVAPTSALVSGQSRFASPQFAAIIGNRAPKEPLPALPLPERRTSNTLPVPAAMPQPRSGSLTSAGSSAAQSGLQSRRSLDPESGDPTQMTMSTVGTSILFSDVDMALRRWTAQQRSRFGSETSRGVVADGYSTPGRPGVPSEQEIQLAAALAKYICNQSEQTRSRDRTSLAERLIEMLGSGARSSPSKRGEALTEDQCNLSHATEATDILSELVAQFKPTPMPSPGGPSMRRGSNASISSSRLLRTPERQQHRLRSHGSRSGSTTTSLYRTQLHSPSSHRSPGRSSIRSRKPGRSNRSREGSIRTNRTYSQSIMSYCSTPVSSSADDLTSLLEGLLETSEGESGEDRQRRVPQPQWGAQSSTPSRTVVPHDSPQTPVASMSRAREAPNTGTSRLNSEAIAAVLDLYQPGNTPARGAKRKEPDLMPSVGSTSASGIKVSPQAHRSGSTGGSRHSSQRSRRISIEQGLRRLQLREAQARNSEVPQPQPQPHQPAYPDPRAQQNIIVAHARIPTASSDIFSSSSNGLPSAHTHLTKSPTPNPHTTKSPTQHTQFPPTPPLTIDRRPTALFSPVPALVITDADVEAKCKAMSRRRVRRERDRSVDSLDCYHTAPGEGSEEEALPPPPPLPVRDVLPPLKKPEWEGESE